MTEEGTCSEYPLALLLKIESWFPWTIFCGAENGTRVRESLTEGSEGGIRGKFPMIPSAGGIPGTSHPPSLTTICPFISVALHWALPPGRHQLGQLRLALRGCREGLQSESGCQWCGEKHSPSWLPVLQRGPLGRQTSARRDEEIFRHWPNSTFHQLSCLSPNPDGLFPYMKGHLWEEGQTTVQTLFVQASKQLSKEVQWAYFCNWGPET